MDPQNPIPLAGANPSLRPEILRMYSVGSQVRTAVLLVNDGLQSVLSQSLSGQQWEIDYRTISAQGQRLLRLTCCPAAGGANFVGIWQPSLMAGVPWRFVYLGSQVVFQSWAQQFFAAGLSVGDVSVCLVGGAPAFSGIWFGLGVASAMNLGMSWPELQTLHATMMGQGFKLVALSGYAENSLAKYAAAWQQTGPVHQQLMTAPSPVEFKAQCEQFQRQGLRLVLMDAFDVNCRDQYSGVWQA